MQLSAPTLPLDLVSVLPTGGTTLTPSTQLATSSSPDAFSDLLSAETSSSPGTLEAPVTSAPVAAAAQPVLSGSEASTTDVPEGEVTVRFNPRFAAERKLLQDITPQQTIAKWLAASGLSHASKRISDGEASVPADTDDSETVHSELAGGSSDTHSSEQNLPIELPVAVASVIPASIQLPSADLPAIAERLPTDRKNGEEISDQVGSADAGLMARVQPAAEHRGSRAPVRVPSSTSEILPARSAGLTDLGAPAAATNVVANSGSAASGRTVPVAASNKGAAVPPARQFPAEAATALPVTVTSDRRIPVRDLSSDSLASSPVETPRTVPLAEAAAAVAVAAPKTERVAAVPRMARETRVTSVENQLTAPTSGREPALVTAAPAPVSPAAPSKTEAVKNVSFAAAPIAPALVRQGSALGETSRSTPEKSAPGRVLLSSLVQADIPAVGVELPGVSPATKADVARVANVSVPGEPELTVEVKAGVIAQRDEFTAPAPAPAIVRRASDVHLSAGIATAAVPGADETASESERTTVEGVPQHPTSSVRPTPSAAALVTNQLPPSVGPVEARRDAPAAFTRTPENDSAAVALPTIASPSGESIAPVMVNETVASAPLPGPSSTPTVQAPDLQEPRSQTPTFTSPEANVQPSLVAGPAADSLPVVEDALRDAASGAVLARDVPANALPVGNERTQRKSGVDAGRSVALVSTSPVGSVEKFAAPSQNFGDGSGNSQKQEQKKSLAPLTQRVAADAENLGINVAKSGSSMPVAAHSPSITAEIEAPSFSAAPVTFDALVRESATLTPEVVQAARRAVDSAMAIVDQYSKGDQKSVNLQFSVSGVDLAVRVELRGSDVHTTFRTDSPELRNALAHEWQLVSSAPAGDRPHRMADPVFTSSATGSAAGNQFGNATQHRDSGARQNADTAPEYSGFRNPTRGSAAPSSAPAAAQLPRNLPASTSSRLNTFA